MRAGNGGEAALGVVRIGALLGCAILTGTVAAGVVHHGYRAAEASGRLEERRGRLSDETSAALDGPGDFALDADGLRLERQGNRVTAVAEDPTACSIATRSLSTRSEEVSGAGAVYSGVGLEAYRAGGKGASGYPAQEICHRVAYPVTLVARMPGVPRG